MSLNLAVVIPWFGPELKGGAEQHAWQIASRLAGQGHKISVLTTCSESFLSAWDEDYYPPDVETVNGMEVHRFSVASRDSGLFDGVNAKLVSMNKASLKPGVSPVDINDELVYLKHNIYSAELDNFISANKTSFDFFIFLPYLFPNILSGISHVGERAILQPCLHDESYAYLPCVARAFREAAHLVFNSDGEQALAARIIGPEVYEKGIVAYAGVEIDFQLIQSESDSMLTHPYLLCLGRRDKTKNTQFLIEAFLAYLDEHPESDLRLVVAGPGTENLSVTDRVIDAELVSEEDKLRLIKQSHALVNPSENESFSRVIFESWLLGRPVVVNQACAATYLALQGSDGAGFAFSNRNSLIDLIGHLDSASKGDLAKLGERGKRFAEQVANWDQVISKYEKLMERRPVVAAKSRSIHQLLPNLSYGDAISQHALYIRDFIRSRGYRSDILVRYIDPRVQSECKLYKPELLNHDDGLIYHHSIGFEHTNVAVGHKGKKALIYHNITPEDFFRPFDDAAADRLRDGRKNLPDIVSSFDHIFGDSRFNCRELELLGKKNTTALKIPMNLSKWNCVSDAALSEQLADGAINILFVGRIAPNKKQTDLVYLLDYLLRIDANYRLILCGGAGDGDRYAESLFELIDELNLSDDVMILDHVTDSQLKAAYQHAAAFVSMSEHEGLGIPLLEAMWFDVPVFAYRSSAVPETLGEAALMLKDKRNLDVFACTIDEVLGDPEAKTLLLEAQRRKRQEFFAEYLVQDYETLVQVVS